MQEHLEDEMQHGQQFCPLSSTYPADANKTFYARCKMIECETRGLRMPVKALPTLWLCVQWQQRGLPEEVAQ